MPLLRSVLELGRAVRSATLQCRAERVDRESSCDVGCSGVAEAVEQKEIVNHSRYAYRCDIDAGFAEPVCVLFAFVSQDVGFVGDDQRGRKSS